MKVMVVREGVERVKRMFLCERSEWVGVICT